jgi:hypothetical protein
MSVRRRVQKALEKRSFMPSRINLPSINCFKQLALVFVTQKLIKIVTTD